MKKYRPILTALIALFFYTLTDIIIWQRIFEANHMSEYADIYHTGWFMSLAGYAIIEVLLLWDEWKDCLYYLTVLLAGGFGNALLHTLSLAIQAPKRLINKWHKKGIIQRCILRYWHTKFCMLEGTLGYPSHILNFLLEILSI